MTIRRSVAAALLMATALLGRVLVVANPLSSPIQFVGDGSPPANGLTLWYREPASDLSWKNGSLVGGPLRLRRGETLRTFNRTARGAVLVFSGEGLRPSSW